MLLSLPRRAAWLIEDRRALQSSESVDIEEIQTVCVTLGPYRNLTTLTAAVMFLHPHCQVLNHAGMRVFGRNQVDFLSDFSSGRLDRFLQYAVEISKGGRRGRRGGSITYSHAFLTNKGIQHAFEDSGKQLLKPHIRSLFWKESLKASTLVSQQTDHLEQIFAADARLRFLLPIRNPIDCAVSNLRTGNDRFFVDLPRRPRLLEVLNAVVKEIFWFEGLRLRFPDRFFSFTQNEISPARFRRISEFLGLPQDESWEHTANDLMQIRTNYQHDPDILENYGELLDRYEQKFPDLTARIRQFQTQQ
jgi:hypothetical protein